MSRGGYKARYARLADEDLMMLVGGGNADAFAASTTAIAAAPTRSPASWPARSRLRSTLPRTPSSRSGRRRTDTGHRGAACEPGSSRWSATTA